MKCIKISLLIVSVLSVNFSFAQWKEDANGIYPTSLDKAVGIGTATPKAALDVNVDIRNGKIGTIFGIMPEGNSVGNGTFLGVVGYSTQLADYSGKGFAIEHHFYGETNSSINFYRGGSTQGGFITFNTNDNTEKMRILANGNVGIGTTNPTEKLSVNGNIEIQNGANTTIGYVFNNTGALNLQANSKSTGLEVGTSASLPIHFYTDGHTNRRMTIANTGNVGIGTTTPTEKLDVVGSIRSTINSDEGGYIALSNPSKTGTNDAVIWRIFNMSGGYGNSLQFWGYSNTVNLGPKLTIKDNGNVGIGTTTPTEKLSVNGNIKAKKLIVTQTGWADYVFDKNYTLMPVDSLSTYINTHKHLPEMPTTKDVQDHGVDVGNNQTLLLKKIEELTLYIIEQHKQITEQHKQLTEQNEQMLNQQQQIIEQNKRLQKLEKSKN